MKYFLLILSVLLLLSCSDSTSSSDNYTVSGKVSLLDIDGNIVSDGLEDIIVMIYNTVDIDPDLLQVKADYPFIGKDINQETFFDIRDEEPIKSVNCNSLGEYSLSITKGDYNICYYREDYGYKVEYELEVTNDIGLSDVALYEVISLAGLISNFIFESGKVYHVTDDLIIPANSNVMFETGAHVDVADNKKIFLTDNFNVIETSSLNVVYFNSIFNYLVDKTLFRGVEWVNSSSVHISQMLIKNATTALSFNSINAEIRISKSSIVNNNIGISTLQAHSINVSTCNIINNSSIGLDLNISNNCSKNIVYNNHEGIRSVEADCDISDSYFLKNHIGARFGFFNSMIIHHNEFSMNYYGLSMSGSNPVIEYNNFLEDDTNIEICRRYIQGNYDYSNPEIVNNNILSSKCQIILNGLNDLFFSGGRYWGVDSNYECKKNFWGQEKKIQDNSLFNQEEGYYFIINEEYNDYLLSSGIIR